jgi:hypothetical protein
METSRMARTKRITSVRIISILSLSLITGSNALSAEQEVITDDGREVLLKEDGSWAFRSTDRFANTQDGRRVQLKQDGSWQYVGNAEMTSEAHVRTTLLDIKLENVVIEKYEQKIQKNVRVKTQAVFYLSLDLSPLANSNISITNNDVSHIEVKDNEGKIYPVLSIEPSPTVLEPNSDTAITIRADGSPKWWGKVKSMEIVLNPGILGIQEPITLSQSVNDFDEKKVDGFEKSE